MNQIALPKTLLDICDERDEILALVQRAHGLLEDADAKMETLNHYGLPLDAKPRHGFKATRQEIDARLWRVAFDKTGFLTLMDAEAKSKFFEQVQKDAPEFTESNIRSTFLSLSQDAGKMFARGLVNVFRRLSRVHRTNTNSPFKVNEKAILPGMFRQRYDRGLEVSHYTHEYLNDIDRVIKTLAGETHHPRSLEMAVNAAMVDGSVYEDAFYQIKGFGNGNMHMKFKRSDLLDKANRIIAEHYGETLAHRKAA